MDHSAGYPPPPPSSDLHYHQHSRQPPPSSLSMSYPPGPSGPHPASYRSSSSSNPSPPSQHYPRQPHPSDTDMHHQQQHYPNVTPPSQTIPGAVSANYTQEIRVPLYFLKADLLARLARFGIQRSEEQQMRLRQCSLVRKVCRKLGFPFKTFTTAQNLFHRYFAFNDVRAFELNDITAACILAACKIEETVKKARDIILAMHRITEGVELDFDSPVVELRKKKLIQIEKIILETICFDVHQLRHAQTFVVKFVKMLEGSVELARKAWIIADESTTVCAQYPAHTIALASIYLAGRLLGDTTLPVSLDAELYVKACCAPEELEDVCQQLIELMIVQPIDYSDDIEKLRSISDSLREQIVSIREVAAAKASISASRNSFSKFKERKGVVATIIFLERVLIKDHLHLVLLPINDHGKMTARMEKAPYLQKLTTMLFLHYQKDKLLALGTGSDQPEESLGPPQPPLPAPTAPPPISFQLQPGLSSTGDPSRNERPDRMEYVDRRDRYGPKGSAPLDRNGSSSYTGHPATPPNPPLSAPPPPSSRSAVPFSSSGPLPGPPNSASSSTRNGVMDSGGAGGAKGGVARDWERDRERGFRERDFVDRGMDRNRARGDWERESGKDIRDQDRGDRFRERERDWGRDRDRGRDGGGRGPVGRDMDRDRAMGLLSLYSYGQKTVGAVTPYAVAAQQTVVNTVIAAKAILDKYPPLKAFVYTLAATSAFPLSVFLGFALMTLMGCLAVAGTGVAFVQGGFLVFAGFVLFWFLAGSFIITSIATFWFTVAYFAFQVAKKIEKSA
ncbi:hypothetical protein HDV05_004957 [Chytridiales sp. JEL 0842]|nr:hypothetical protein HDV05_004957 [Chytridiales sp. JEL 0842]